MSRTGLRDLVSDSAVWVTGADRVGRVTGAQESLGAPRGLVSGGGSPREGLRGAGVLLGEDGVGRRGDELVRKPRSDKDGATDRSAKKMD